jgi:hypothetical protein
MVSTIASPAATPSMPTTMTAERAWTSALIIFIARAAALERVECQSQLCLLGRRTPPWSVEEQPACFVVGLFSPCSELQGQPSITPLPFPLLHELRERH